MRFTYFITMVLCKRGRRLASSAFSSPEPAILFSVCPRIDLVRRLWNENEESALNSMGWQWHKMQLQCHPKTVLSKLTNSCIFKQSLSLRHPACTCLPRLLSRNHPPPPRLLSYRENHGGVANLCSWLLVTWTIARVRVNGTGQFGEKPTNLRCFT